MIDLEPIREIADACPALVGMGDDDDFVAPVYEL